MLPPELGQVQAWWKCNPATFRGAIWHYLPETPSGLGIPWLEMDPTEEFPYMGTELSIKILTAALCVTAKGRHNLEMCAETCSGHQGPDTGPDANVKKGMQMQAGCGHMVSKAHS